MTDNATQVTRPQVKKGPRPDAPATPPGGRDLPEMPTGGGGGSSGEVFPLRRDQLKTLISGVKQQNATEILQLMEDVRRDGNGGGGGGGGRHHDDGPVTFDMDRVMRSLQRARVSMMEMRLMNNMLKQEGWLGDDSGGGKSSEVQVLLERIERMERKREEEEKERRLMEMLGARDQRVNEILEQLADSRQGDPRMDALRNELVELKNQTNMANVVRELKGGSGDAQLQMMMTLMNSQSEKDRAHGQQMLQMMMSSSDKYTQLVAESFRAQANNRSDLDTYLTTQEKLSHLIGPQKEDKPDRLERIFEQVKGFAETEAGKEMAKGLGATAKAAVERARSARSPAGEYVEPDYSQVAQDDIASMPKANCPACGTLNAYPQGASFVHCGGGSCEADFTPSGQLLNAGDGGGHGGHGGDQPVQVRVKPAPGA